MYPPKKPVGGKTFPQGREILQAFKNWGEGGQTHAQHQKQSKPPKPKLHNKQQEQH